jgi:hypothetical protein
MIKITKGGDIMILKENIAKIQGKAEPKRKGVKQNVKAKTRANIPADMAPKQ